MLNGLLANAGNETAVSIPEAALYALLGFATVFLGIAFLILVVWLVGKAMAKPIAKPVEKKAEPVKENVVANLAVADASEEEISEETLAVITAAIMAYYQQTKPKCEFTVKRIKRI